MADPNDSEPLPTEEWSASDAARGLRDPVAENLLAGAQAARSPAGCWQPPSVEDLQCALPQYRIDVLAGRGGMGAVYRGWQRSLDRFVAIKILPPALFGGDEFAARFKGEAKAMAQLKHPGIVPVYDAGETADGLLYFVMDYVEGTDLQKTLAAHGRLPPEEALSIISKVLDALSYAHQRGIIHHDIKPANIMVDPEGHVLVADFGLARSMTPDSALLTMSNTSLGTPNFMAPESHLGVDHVDHRADLYAVGVMLYQMLTGHLPCGRFDPPSRVVPGLDKRLDGIVDRALQSDRDARYSSALELKSALDPVLARAVARGKITANRARFSFPKKRLLIIPAALVGLATVGSVFWEKPGRHDAPPPAHNSAVAPSIADEPATLPLNGRVGVWVPVTFPLDDPKLPPGAVAADGALTLTRRHILPDLVAKNAAIRARLRRPAGIEYSGLQLRKRRADRASFFFGWDAAWLGRAASKPPRTPTLPLRPGQGEIQPVFLEFATIGDTAYGWVDGVALPPWTGSVPLTSGAVGLWSENGEFRDVEFMLLDGLPEAEALMLLGIAPIAVAPSSGPAAAAPFVNTLGMRFMPVPITGGPTGGQRVLFSVWETRMKDFEAFAKATNNEWKRTGAFGFPVRNVTWHEARNFCAWLTERERASGRLSASERYRLPTDHEWSCAAGISEWEEINLSPVEKDGKLANIFLWGPTWPPPPRAGNFAGEEARHPVAAGNHPVLKAYMSGYRDDHLAAAPVGSYDANAFGLHDLTGNLWEWCEDATGTDSRERPLRGGAWDSANPELLRATKRLLYGPDKRGPTKGFRVVLAPESTFASPAAE